MPPVEHLRQILPFAVALYLAASVAHLQAKPSTVQLASDGLALATIVSGLKWHVLEMARSERAEMFSGFHGN